MECRYCQTTNAEDDHRCGRCGRRLRMTPLYTAKSSAALALRYEPDEAKALDTVPPPAPRRPITYQPSLFASRELPRVVPFETIAPGPVQAPVRRAVSSKPRVRRPKVVSGQQDLPFAPNAPSRRARPSEGVIYCDAPVAPPAHRAVAVLLDGVLISIGLAVFGSIFWLAGGRLHWNAQTLPVLLGVVAGVVLLYNLLWCLGDGDTAGMKWSHLKLVDFDGHVPNRAQRFKRMASGLLSLAAAGLGLLWALADTETLTWHDHISKTFPTPY
jgi:hypothetical protein